MAYLVYDSSVGAWENNSQYGGDAYTGIQNAAAQFANNVYRVGEMLQLAFTGMFAIQGGVLIFGSLCIRTKPGREEPQRNRMMEETPLIAPVKDENERKDLWGN